MQLRQLRGWLLRLFGLLHRKQRECEFADELESHLAFHIEDNLRAGLSPEEARRIAHIKLGGVTQIKELHREQGGLPMIETFLQDLRFGVRMLRTQPGFTLIAVVTLALGIGVNSAIFSVVYSTLLRPLPYPNAERLVYVWAAYSQHPDVKSSMAPLNYDDLRRQSQSFDGYFAFVYASFSLTGEGQPESLSGVGVTGDFGRVMQVQPTLGRVFTLDEDVPGKNRVVVISHGLWQRRFAGNPNVVGQAVQLNGAAHTILGVMPPGFAFPARETDVWKPMALEAAKLGRANSFLRTLARLKAGVTLAQARAEASAIAQGIVRDNASTVRDAGFALVPLRKQLVGDLERPLWVLMASVFAVLLIACVNVANLVLGRATGRWREVSLRAALGATRWQLMRLVLIESLLLSLLGGACGLALGSLGLDALLKFNPNVAAEMNDVTMNSAVVAFTFALTLFTGLFFGLFPAWQMSKTDLSQGLRQSSRSATGSSKLKWVRNGLVVAEIGLSLVLLISAGLLIKSFWKLMQIHPGFNAENVATAYVALPRARYQDEWQQAEFYRRTLEAMRAIPGVQHVSAATSLPFSGARDTTSFNVDARPTPPNTQGPQADSHEVFPGYFQTMGIPLKAGRDFTEADDRTHPGVVIINERAAQKYFPNEDPIGKRLTVGSSEEQKLYGQRVSREIIGVVGNIKLQELSGQFEPELYLPALQLPAAGMALVLRGNGPAEQLISGMRNAVQAVDSLQPVIRPGLLSSAIEESVTRPRFSASLLPLFAGLAMVLALVGIYGVMSYSVAQRTKEIGIRIALGAASHDVLRQMLREGFKLIVLGLSGGLLLAFFVTRWLREMLYEVTPFDGLTFGGVAVLLAVVGLVACWIPARRATKVDPMIALRHD